MKAPRNSHPIDAANQGRAAAWAQAAMERELSDLAGTIAHRNEALNKAAFAIGQLVGGKLVAYDVANDGLVKVAQDIGLLEPSEKNKTLDTIRRSLADGMKQPRHGPDASSAVHGGWRRPNGADDQQEGDGAREFARRMWDAARLVTNTLASVYLRSRSIASPPPPSVRFHPETPMPGGS